MDAEPEIEAVSPSLEEFAQTAGRYKEVLSRLKILQARLLLTTANHSKAIKKRVNATSEAFDVSPKLDELNEEFHDLNIHEEMLKVVKDSRLRLESNISDSTNEVNDGLMKEQCANQATLFKLANEMREERQAGERATTKLLDNLCKYTASLRNDLVKLNNRSSAEEDSKSLEKKKHLEKLIKEIRFMQICISQMILTKNVDLSKEPSIKDILKSVRDPITSIENFI